MLRKLIWILILLGLTNGAVYLWGELRVREAKAEAAQRLESSARLARERQAQISELEQKLVRLEAWGHLVELQERLRAVDEEIERLNYGNAREQLEQLEGRIRAGEMGGLLAGMAEELAPRFEAVRAELNQMGEGASGRLAELGRTAFEIVSGFASEEPGGPSLDPELELRPPEPMVDESQDAPEETDGEPAGEDYAGGDAS